MAPNPRKLAPGTQLGPFTIRERLGRGATATVYGADDQTSHTLVALKVLHRTESEWHDASADDLAGDEDESFAQQLGRLRREVELAQRINHPGVCRLFAVHESMGLTFLSMQLVNGFNLETVLASEGRLAPPRAARIMEKVATALDAAHTSGVVHRDLKPGNIVLRPGEEPIILDFGYATGKDVGSLTRTGVWVGTLSYAAPELLNGEKATKKCDLFALGVILYQCITGELPFSGHTYGEIAAALQRCAPKAARETVPELSAEFEGVVHKALRREAKERFASASELAEALSPFARGEGCMAPMLDEHTLTAKRLHHVTLLIARPAPADTTAIDDWGGERADCGVTGLAATFASADDALRAALAVRREVEQEGELGTQIGLATGDVLVRRGTLSGDVADLARDLCASASVGDIVLTPATRLSLRARKLSLACQPFVPLGRPGRANAEVYRYAADGREKTAMYKPAAMPTAAAAWAAPAARPLPRTPTETTFAALPPKKSTTPTSKKAAGPASAKRGAEAHKAMAEALPLDPASLRELHRDLTARTTALRRDKGIVPGDDLTLDSLERTADLEHKRGRLLQACGCLRSALTELEGAVIDAAFVKNKIQRLDRALRDKRLLRDMTRFAPLLEGIMAAFESQDFAAANAALNRAFDVLRTP